MTDTPSSGNVHRPTGPETEPARKIDYEASPEGEPDQGADADEAALRVITTWLAHPDVVADPDQVGELGRWTTERDVITPHPVRNGSLVVACWGDTTWTAEARWDDNDINLLWLTPVLIVRRPDAEAAMRHVFTAGGRPAAAPGNWTTSSDPTSHGEPPRWHVDVVISFILDEMNNARTVAMQTLRFVEGLGENRRRSFSSSWVALDLARLARRRRVDVE